MWSSPSALFPTSSKYRALRYIHDLPTYHGNSVRFVEAWFSQHMPSVATNLRTRQIEEVGVLVELVKYGARSVLDLRGS